ncbi:MAG: sulfite exporter TauE/SafE family protein [Acidobacteriota bacterium]
MFEFAFLFPVGVVIATVGMSSGVAGSNFWLPVYLIWLGLDPRLAFWASLVTMLFGFGSGVARNLAAGTVDRDLVRDHAPWVLGAAVAGAVAAPRLRIEPLLAGYALFVIAYGSWLSASTWRRRQPAEEARQDGPGEPLRLRAGVAGLLQGLIATGAGALLMPAFLAERPRAPAHAVGSSVTLVLLASAVAALVRVDAGLWRTLTANAEQVASMTVFAAAGAVLGGQVGPRVAARLPSLWLKRYVALVLLAVGLAVARRVFVAGP